MTFESALVRLDSIARHPLIECATPIQRLKGLATRAPDRLRGVNVFVKQDDFMALGGGGNKLRKLEFHAGRALAERADTIITVGGLQSNHARLTAAVAAQLNLHCELVLSRVVPRNDDDYESNGNVLLDKLFGARVHMLDSLESTLSYAEARARALRAEGRRVLVVPAGGSSAIGALGYVRCAEEIVIQEAQLGLEFSEVVVPNGSGGTQAGLIAGFAAFGHDTVNVRGFGVLAPENRAQTTTAALLEEVCGLLGIDVPLGRVHVDNTQCGAGYGMPTNDMIEAVRLLARTEGLMLDPVYSGKAFAGLLNDIRSGRHEAGTNVLFVMTGGQPGIYAYRRIFEA